MHLKNADETPAHPATVIDDSFLATHSPCWFGAPFFMLIVAHHAPCMEAGNRLYVHIVLAAGRVVTIVASSLLAEPNVVKTRSV